MIKNYNYFNLAVLAFLISTLPVWATCTVMISWNVTMLAIGNSAIINLAVFKSDLFDKAMYVFIFLGITHWSTMSIIEWVKTPKTTKE
jgi:hypothetical protein